MSKTESHAGALLTFEYYPAGIDEERQVTFAVDANALWSADGLARTFDLCRSSFLVNPGTDGYDEACWESWHLLRAEESPAATFFIVSEKTDKEGGDGSE